MARAGLVAVAVLAATTGLGSFEPALDPRALSDAIDIGQSRIDDRRSRFHALYHVEVGRAPVDYVEVVTPFRRVALEAETRTRAGERLFGQRQALATLGTEPFRVDIVVEMTFHPLNTFVGVPGYTVALSPMVDSQPVLPQQVTRTPRFGPRLTTQSHDPYSSGASPLSGGPLLGGTMIATFDGRTLEAHGSYWVVIRDSEQELARAGVDFSKLR